MFIGTQMPMPNTTADIWRMVYDYKATCIVMLNPLDPDDEVSSFASNQKRRIGPKKLCRNLTQHIKHLGQP